MRTVRSAILTLGLLGSAALAGLGPLTAHAAGPQLKIAPGNCYAYVTGSGFTPNGKVDLYAYRNNGTGWQFIKDYVETATPSRFVPPGFLVGGGYISQLVSDGNNGDTIWVMAYDESANLWSNYTQTTEYCLQ
jgi:hypothetical protein